MSTLQAIPDRRAWAAGPRAFVEHYASTLLGQGCTLALGTVTGILAARMLGPVARGEYAAVVLWPMAIATFLSCGINQAITFQVGRSAFTVSEVATAAATLGFMQGALSILLGLLVVPFALAKYSPAIQHLGVVCVLFTPALILGGYPANLFQGRQDLLRFNVIRVAAPLLYFAGLVGLYGTGRGSVTSILAFHIAGWLAALALSSAMVGGILKPRVRWNSAAIPRLLHFGVRTQVTNLTNYFNQRIDQLLLSLFVPPRQLGLYAVAVTLSTGVTVFPQAAGIVTFSRGASQPRDDAKRTIGVSFRASLLWLLIGCSALYVLTPFLIRLLFGEAFAGSIAACRILLPGTLFIGLNQVLYNGASALGRPELPACGEGISMAVTGIGLYVLVPRYGYLGAAIISSIAYTNQGNLIGNTVGRMGRAIQFWFSYWISPKNTLQFTCRHSTVSKDFVPQGGAWQDYSLRHEMYLHSGLYVKSQLQYEHISRYPLLFSGPQRNVTAVVELGFVPHKSQ